MPNATPSLETIFSEAIELPNAAQRADYLARVCGSDDVLRRRVEALVEAHFHAGGSFLERAPDEDATVAFVLGWDELTGPDLGTVIGPYTLREQLGEGGMGLVYVAEQTQPVRRKVALKVIKPGMDTRQVVGRFEAERQALALMDHPNIARVLDAGATPEGRPFFVMELVKGEPITDYCDRHRLTLRERLELFLQVCRAVQHAHQKGVIHRDIKPSNVLVAVHDVTPVVKVIDFGIAKAVGQVLTDKTVYTAVAQLIGTPLYMSPEQAGHSSLDVDTRTDIHALGVLLYELLTGTTPIDPETLRKAALDEVRRIIREDEPARPSVRLSTLKAAAISTVADRRGEEARRLTRAVRGELDWVVMKCLEKDRERRYETVGTLAGDLHRYLTNEPVTACPPSATYRLKKFVKRNRGPVLAVTLILLALVAGIVGTTWALLRATEAEAQAREEASQKETARAAAVAEGIRATEAEQAAKKDRDAALDAKADTDAFSKFLMDHVLAVARPKGVQNGLGIDVTVAQALEAAEGKIATVFAGRPQAEATARLGIGVTWRNLSRHDKAVEHLERALALREQELGPDHSRTLDAMNSLGVAYEAAGQLHKSVSMHEQAFENRKAKHGLNHAATLLSMNNLAESYDKSGQFQKAMHLYEQALEVLTKRDPDHHLTLMCMNNLGQLYRKQGAYAKAEPLLVKSLEVRSRVAGKDHPSTLTAMNNLAGLRQQQGRLAEAEPLLVEALEAHRRVMGEDHAATLTSINNLGLLYVGLKDYARAEQLYTQVLEARRRVLGNDHPDTLNSLSNLGALHRALRQHARAEMLLVEALDARRRVLGEDHPDTLVSMSNLAVVYADQGKYDLAQSLELKVLEVRRRVLGDDHPETIRSMSNLATTYSERREFALASPLFREALEWTRKRHGENSPQVAAALSSLGLNLLKQEKYADAEPLLRQCLKIRVEKEPDDWKMFSTKSTLGGSLLGQKKHAEAEPLLLQGYEGMKQREGKLSPTGKVRLSEAIERLVQLYEAMGRPERAAEWREKLPPPPMNPSF